MSSFKKFRVNFNWIPRQVYKDSEQAKTIGKSTDCELIDKLYWNLLKAEASEYSSGRLTEKGSQKLIRMLVRNISMLQEQKEILN